MSQREDVSVVQFATALNPTIIPLRIVTVLCERISGAAFLSWIAIPLTAFEYSKGNPKKLISSAQGTKIFVTLRNSFKLPS